MQRAILGALLLVLGVAGVVAYTTVTRDREYARRIAAGDTAVATGRDLDAIEDFTAALTLKPASMLAYFKRGELYRRRGEWTSALRDLSYAARLDPLAPRPLERLGDAHYALGRYGRAVERYTEYVALDDRSPRVLYKLALARQRNGTVASAIDAARQALALQDDFPEAYYLLGTCLHEAGRPAEAVAALERAVELAPAMTVAREQLASLYRDQGQTQNEITALRALTAIEPARPDREIELGLAYARAGRTDQAVQTLNRAAELFPDSVEVYTAAGRVWLEIAERRGDRVALSKAIEALQRPAATNAATSETLTLLGRALLISDELDLAVRILEQAADTLPVDPDAFVWLVEAATRRALPLVARDALVDHRSLVGWPESAAERTAFAVSVAELSLEGEQPAVAAEWFRRALDSSDAPALWVRLAEARLNAGALDDARAATATALARHPGHPALVAIRDRLPGGTR